MKSAPSGEDENLPGEGEEPPLDQDTILGEEELPQPPAVLTKIVNNSGAALFGLMQGGELAFLENCGDSGFALAEIMRDASIHDCVNRANIVCASRCSCNGGLVGYASNTEFQNCFNYGKTGGVSFSGTGGIVGSISSSTLTNCWNFGETGSTEGGSRVGGLAGMMSDSTAYWQDEKALTEPGAGSIQAADTEYVGGIFGTHEYNVRDPMNMFHDAAGQNISLERCAAEMDITATGETVLVGGVAAWLLDSGEEHPTWSGHSVYRLKVESGPHGTLTVPGLGEDGFVYGKAGAAVTAQPSGETFERDDMEYHYETDSVTLVWVDENGEEHRLSLSGGGLETPTVMEILPLPLREPHILAVAGGAVALLAAGILLRIKKQCKD